MHRLSTTCRQVWHLSHVARRFQSDESELRRLLYEQTGGMFPELVTRPALKLFLPPINGPPPDPESDRSPNPNPNPNPNPDPNPNPNQG